MSNSQKTPFSVSINSVIAQRISDALQGLGNVLPCHVVAVDGAIVTVNFDVQVNNNFTLPPVTCSTIGSRYSREPIQVNDAGVCISADVKLGGVTGLGKGAAPITSASNLGALIFIPVGNINWETLNADAYVISAPDGAIIQTDDGTSSVIISETQIALNFQGNSIVITSSGIAINGVLTINGVPFLLHEHLGVTVGSGVTGGVV